MPPVSIGCIYRKEAVLKKNQGTEPVMIDKKHVAGTAKENSDTAEAGKRKFSWKRYEELTFADDFMFCKVLTERPDLCQEMVEVITGRKVREIRNLVAQLSKKEYYDGKGVRFDVYFEDEEKIVYDFEMQTVSKEDLPRRVRYYQSMIDTSHLRAGKKYQELPDSYVVFICLEDPFSYDLPKYTYHERCDEASEILLDDGKTSIFLNASSSKMADGALKDFLLYVGNNLVSSDFTKSIDEEVKRVIDDHNGRRLYMLFEQKLEEATAYGEKRGREIGRHEGRKEGRKEGKKEGRKEGTILGHIMACLYFGLSKEETKKKIMEIFHLSSSEADKYIKMAESQNSREVSRGVRSN